MKRDVRNLMNERPFSEDRKSEMTRKGGTRLNKNSCVFRLVKDWKDEALETTQGFFVHESENQMELIVYTLPNETEDKTFKKIKELTVEIQKSIKPQPSQLGVLVSVNSMELNKAEYIIAHLFKNFEIKEFDDSNIKKGILETSSKLKEVLEMGEQIDYCSFGPSIVSNILRMSNINYIYDETFEVFNFFNQMGFPFEVAMASGNTHKALEDANVSFNSTPMASENIHEALEASLKYIASLSYSNTTGEK